MLVQKRLGSAGLANTDEFLRSLENILRLRMGWRRHGGQSSEAGCWGEPMDKEEECATKYHASQHAQADRSCILLLNQVGSRMCGRSRAGSHSGKRSLITRSYPA